MLRKFVLASAIVTFSTRAFADASTFCLYALLLESHLIVTHCGDSLDGPREKLYQEELAAVRMNLIADSHQAGKTLAERTASVDGYEARMRAQYASHDKSVCKSRDYLSDREILNRLVSVRVLSGVQADLKAHRDPDKGECL